MIRFFVNQTDIEDKLVRLSTHDAAHVRSLRLRPSEFFIICDGEGTDYICRLHESGDKASKCEQTYAEIVKTCRSDGEPGIKCSIYIAYSKGERLEYAVQKSVELGAYEIRLFPSKRCVAIPKDKDKKILRLQKIALETAKQSARGIVPHVIAEDSLEMAVIAAAKADLPLLPYECEDRLNLKNALETAQAQTAGLSHISVMTGPEGGFEEDEVLYAKSKAMQVVTLGRRILRCETAPIAVLSAIMFHTGNLG